MRVASLKRVGLCWCFAWPLRGRSCRRYASQAVSTSCHCNENFCPPSGSDTHLQIRRAPRSAATWVDVIMFQQCILYTSMTLNTNFTSGLEICSDDFNCSNSINQWLWNTVFIWYGFILLKSKLDWYLLKLIWSIDKNLFIVGKVKMSVPKFN